MLNPGARLLLRLSCGAMCLSCFWAWSDVVFATVSRRPVTLSQAATLLAAAALAQALHHRRGWRLITVILLDAVTFAVSFMWLVGRHLPSAPAFGRVDRWPAFLAAGRSAMDWGVLFLLLVCSGGLWYCGTRLTAHPPERPTVSRRFDAGLASLLLLLVIELLAAVKGAAVPGEPSATRPVIAFFVLGLFSMGLVRLDGSAAGQNAAYVRGAGTVFSFAAVTLLFGGGLFVLFLPELKTAAETGLSVMATAREPLERLVVAVVRLWLGPGRALRPGADSAPPPPMPAPGEGGGLLSWIVSLILAVPVLAIVLAAAALALFLLIRRLFAKGSKKTEPRGLGHWLKRLPEAFAALLATLRAGLSRRQDPSAAARHCYRRLLRWGRVAGMVRAAAETPAEYGLRLRQRFPKVEAQIDLLVGLHSGVVYGEKTPDGRQLLQARAALRSMCRPGLWPARLKSLLFSSHPTPVGGHLPWMGGHGKDSLNPKQFL